MAERNEKDEDLIGRDVEQTAWSMGANWARINFPDNPRDALVTGKIVSFGSIHAPKRKPFCIQWDEFEAEYMNRAQVDRILVHQTSISGNPELARTT